MLCAAATGAIVGQLLGASAFPVAIPLALTGCGTLAIWWLTRAVRAGDVHSH
jgi:hypothetical protein